MTASHTGANQRRSRAALLIMAGGLACLLAGCNQTTVAKQQEYYPADYRDRHPITLKEGQQTVQIFVGRNRGGLLPAQRAEVLAFARQWRREATSGIIIEVPHGGPTDRAAADSLREVHSILAASGVPSRAVYTRNYQPSETSLASINIRYAKLVAQAGPCGLWPHDLGPAPDLAYNDNKPYWNLGCATQHNLAAEIDNPADLVQPRGEAPAYQARRSVSTDKWRKGENPSGSYSGYDTGKITDIAK